MHELLQLFRKAQYTLQQYNNTSTRFKFTSKLISLSVLMKKDVMENWRPIIPLVSPMFRSYFGSFLRFVRLANADYLRHSV
jgi:hypothetical protein